jgi:iron complex transport system substrate-binding protein
MNKLILIIISISFLFFISCDDEKEFSPENSIKDDAGNIFSLELNPKRIISLAPNITETIYALKADSLLVGVTQYCDYPPEAKTKEIVGSMLDPNLEKISALKPDLIIVTTEGNSKYTYLSLKNSGYKVFVSNSSDINGISRMILNIGRLTGKLPAGKKLAEKIEDDRKYYKLENTTEKMKNCLLVISLNPLITVNKFTYLNEVMELAGFENIYKDELIEYPNINYEDVLIKNPDYIFYLCDTANKTYMDESLISIKSKLSTVKACKNNRVFPADENLVSRPGPRVMESVKMLKSKVF